MLQTQFDHWCWSWVPQTQLAPFSVGNVTCHLSCGLGLTISVTLGNITSARAISHFPQMLFNLRVLPEKVTVLENQKSFQGWAPVLKADVMNVSEGDWTHSQGPDSAPCGSFKAHIHNYFWFPHTDLVLAQVKNGEGNGTPLQHSCLENPMDGGAG